MAVTFTKSTKPVEATPPKSKTKAKAVVTAAPNVEAIHEVHMTELKRLVDEYGPVQEKVKFLDADPAHKKLKELDVEIQTLADSVFHKDQPGVIDGDKYRADISAKKQSSEVPDTAAKEKALKLLGDTAFMAICTLPLTALRKHLTEDQLGGILVSEHTGKRTIKPIKVVK